MESCLRSELLSRLGFRHAFSLRSGGVSAPPFNTLNLGRAVGDAPEAVQENHARLARIVGYAPERLYEVSQVHGGALARVDPSVSPALFRGREADALVSSEAGCAIGVRVADCAAVLLADARGGAVAAVHAGWRGVVAEVVPRAVSELGSVRGAAPAALVAAVFPCIGADAFEVGPDVAEQLARAAGAHVVRPVQPRPHVDLAGAVCAQLALAGLPAAGIERVAGCTFSEPDRFFSYRRDGARSGRHMAVILPRC